MKRPGMKYVNHLGETVSMDDDGIYPQAGTLADWSIKYRSLNGRTTGFYFSPVELTLSLSIVAETEERGLLLRDRMHEVMRRDVDAGKPGTLHVGEWYVKCFCIKSGKTAWNRIGSIAKYKLTLLVDDPRWTREHNCVFRSTAEYGDGLNYPHGYPHNYAAQASIGLIEGISYASAAVITVYGPAETPMVTIGGNRYQIDVTVPIGGILVIDGLAKTIKMKSEYGMETNVFHLRRGSQKKGSGTYVFEPVPAGASLVTWDGSFGFDVVLHEKSSEWRWSDWM